MLLVRPELRIGAGGGPVGSGCTVCSVGGGCGGVVAIAHTGQTGEVVVGCTAVACGAAVLQAEGLEAHFVVLCQDGPHLQAVVEGARHMEGHDTGGHGALGGGEREEVELSTETEGIQGIRDEKEAGRDVGSQIRDVAQVLWQQKRKKKEWKVEQRKRNPI